MNRAIHGAVRRDLSRFTEALRAFPDGDRARADALGRAWRNFQLQLTEHHEGEHAIAWPALRAVGLTDELLATFDAEHEAMAEALAAAGTAMDALVRTAAGPEAEAALAAVDRLHDVTATHLEHEEAEVEQLYWDKRDSPEIKAMGREFGKVGPSKGGQFFAWVLDGATPEEEAAIRRDVPGPVMMIIGGVFGRSYRKNIAPVWRG